MRRNSLIAAAKNYSGIGWTPGYYPTEGRGTDIIYARTGLSFWVAVSPVRSDEDLGGS